MGFGRETEEPVRNEKTRRERKEQGEGRGGVYQSIDHLEPPELVVPMGRLRLTPVQDDSLRARSSDEVGGSPAARLALAENVASGAFNFGGAGRVFVGGLWWGWKGEEGVRARAREMGGTEQKKRRTTVIVWTKREGDENRRSAGEERKL